MQPLILISVALWMLQAVVCTGAQRPHPCKSPPLMVGKVSMVNPSGHAMAYERFSYDALERRIRIRASAVVDNKTKYEDVLLLFREGVFYEISYRNKTCKKAELKGKFQPIEVPVEAQLLGQAVLGTFSVPGGGLLVNSWTGLVPGTKVGYITTFTEFGCIPVSTLSYSKETGASAVSFYDFLIGIEDPNEFIPPPFCDKAEFSHDYAKSAKSFFNFLG